MQDPAILIIELAAGKRSAAAAIAASMPTFLHSCQCVCMQDPAILIIELAAGASAQQLLPLPRPCLHSYTRANVCVHAGPCHFDHRAGCRQALGSCCHCRVRAYILTLVPMCVHAGPCHFDHRAGCRQALSSCCHFRVHAWRTECWEPHHQLSCQSCRCG